MAKVEEVKGEEVKGEEVKKQIKRTSENSYQMLMEGQAVGSSNLVSSNST
jgi:hypothetical protein